MLDPERLELLVQLHELSTMRAVANASNMSVSSVSQHLAALERSLGRPLTEKTGRRVRLTPLGEELVRMARPVLDSLREMEDRAHSESHEVRGHLRVASFTSALAPLAIPVCAEMSGEYPDLTLSLVEQEPDQSVPLVRAGQVDMAISASFGPLVGTGRSSDLVTVPLLSDALCAVLPPTHPLATDDAVSIDQLADDPWIVEPSTTYLSSHVTSLSEAAGIEPRHVASLNSYHAILQAVDQGLGVSLLPQLATVGGPSGVSALPLEPRVDRTIALVTTRAQTARLSGRTLIARVREQARLLDRTS